MVDDDIAAYYAAGQEQARLGSGARRIEYLRIRDLLSRQLPPPPATVLDVGGGAGIYALPLAAEGYQVHLVDPIPLHVDQARSASAAAAVPLASAAAGDARALGAADACIDVVLMFGPLYHLQDSEDRLAALREARRVLRPGGVLLAIALSRLYPLFEAIAAGEMDPAEAEAEFLSAGRYRNPSGDPRLFTTSYFHRPDELAGEVRQAGFVLRRLAAGSGALKLLVPDLGEQLDDPDQAARLLDLMRLVEAEPSLLGMSQNIVAIAAKPDRP